MTSSTGASSRLRRPAQSSAAGSFSSPYSAASASAISALSSCDCQSTLYRNSWCAAVSSRALSGSCPFAASQSDNNAVVLRCARGSWAILPEKLG